jgi:hypothetical protein
LAKESILGDEVNSTACEVDGGAENNRVTGGVSEMEERLFAREEQANE